MNPLSMFPGYKTYFVGAAYAANQASEFLSGAITVGDFINGLIMAALIFTGRKALKVANGNGDATPRKDK